MFKKNSNINKNSEDRPVTVKDIGLNNYVNDLFLDINRGNFLYYAAQYISNLMVYHRYIEEFILKGMESKEVQRKSLNEKLNLMNNNLIK